MLEELSLLIIWPASISLGVYIISAIFFIGSEAPRKPILGRNLAVNFGSTFTVSKYVQKKVMRIYRGIS